MTKNEPVLPGHAAFGTSNAAGHKTQGDIDIHNHEQKEKR